MVFRLPPRARSTTTLAIWVAVLAVDLLVAIVATRYTLGDRRTRFAGAERTNENLARVLAEGLEGTVRLIDLALEEVKGELELQRSRGTFSDAELEATIARLHSKVGFLDGIRTAGTSGRVEHGIDVPKGPPVEVGDRDYFIRAKTDPGAKLIVSAPLVSRVTGRRSLIFARRTQLRDGSFGGVVYAVVLLEHFTRTLARVDVGRDGTVALRDKELALIARQPAAHGPASPLGQRSVSPELQAIVEGGKDEAAFISVSPVDGLEKVTAYRRVAGGSFHLIVSSTVDVFLEDWRANAIRTAAGVLLFVILSMLGAWFLNRLESRETETRFRALIDEAPIAMALTRESRVLYVNREFVRTFRMPGPEAAVGHSIVDGVEPGEAAPMLERAERRARGLPVPATFEVTLPRSDGSSFRAAVTDAAVEVQGGRTLVAFIQDVTERSRHEQERERLITDLTKALSDVRTLSGLLPICAHCKKIRDDRGYWNRIETFIRERSGAEFTHGICPDCAEKHFPDPTNPSPNGSGER